MNDNHWDSSKRARKLNNYSVGKSGSVIYWMSRDQRVDYNWALLFAQNLAETNKQEFKVVFSLDINYPGATLRSFHFLLNGLMEIERKLASLSIPFYLLLEDPVTSIPNFIDKNNVGIIVTDFDPLRIKHFWKSEIIKKINIPFFEVDAHNIIPCWLASSKAEYGAYTLRPKIKKLLPEFLTGFPQVKIQDNHNSLSESIDWNLIFKSLSINDQVKPVNWIKPNEEESQKALHLFIENKLSTYNEKRNDPNEDATSNLSPYLHFGQISAQFVAMEILKSDFAAETKDSFLEELIIRRELSDNFCYYTPNYDSFDGFPAWAQKTLNEHRDDCRTYVYSLEIFENAETHDVVWNAAQKELLQKGIIHGYMRMYWAKKILEWTQSPEKALQIANYLNDKYALDGRDPNGYTGCAWAIGGVHDRAWSSRNIFGKIRFMNENGCRRKFDTQKYCDTQNYHKTD